jgi:hypothetical protein
MYDSVWKNHCTIAKGSKSNLKKHFVAPGAVISLQLPKKCIGIGARKCVIVAFQLQERTWMKALEVMSSLHITCQDFKSSTGLAVPYN